VVDAGGLIGEPLLTPLQPFHDAWQREPLAIAALTVRTPVVAASVTTSAEAVSPTEIIAPSLETIPCASRFIAHGVGEPVPHALLICRDAKTLVQKT
jgi:hypothetical protein